MVPGESNRASRDSLAASLEPEVRRLVERDGWSGVICIQRAGEVLFEQAAGAANLADGIPVAPNTRFQLASACKAFTAVAMLKSVEAGTVDLDAPFAKYLADKFPAFRPDATVRQLLSHTSGVPDYFDESKGEAYEDLWRARPMYAMQSPRDFLPMFQHAAQVFAPGQRFAYNNAGFILLGLMLEHLHGAPFADVIEQHVFGPAGMGDSGYFPLDQLPARVANAYIREPDCAPRTNIYSVPKVGGPDGGAFSTAADMTRFWQALDSGVLLAPATYEQLRTPPATTDPRPDGHTYGLGIWLMPAPGNSERLYVCGWDPGVSCLSTFVPADELSITILTGGNFSYWSLHKLALAALA